MQAHRGNTPALKAIHEAAQRFNPSRRLSFRTVAQMAAEQQSQHGAPAHLESPSLATPGAQSATREGWLPIERTGSPPRESPNLKQTHAPWKLGPVTLPHLPPPSSRGFIPNQEAQARITMANSLDRMKKFLKQIGIRDINQDKMEEHHVEKLMKYLRRNQVTFSEVIASVTNNIPGSPFSPKRMRVIVQEFLDLLPAHVGEALKRRKIHVLVLSDAEMDGGCASFQFDQLRLNGDVLVTGLEMLRSVFHEMSHWLDDMVPGYREVNREHVRVRTNNFSEPLQSLRIDYTGKEYPLRVIGMRDDFRDLNGNEYGGRAYNGIVGSEVPSTCLEILSMRPSVVAAYLNAKSQLNVGRYSWRESFLVALLPLF